MMNEKLKTDLDNFAAILEAAKLQCTHFLDTINERPTSSTQSIEFQRTMPQNGVGSVAVLDIFKSRFDPLLVASSGARYWGFVTGGATPAAIVGDWLAAVYDQNPQGVKGQGDISANIELETVNLLCDLLDLPNDFLGGFVTGAMMSNFTCLAVARQWYGAALGKDFAKQGITEKITVFSATAHSSAVKSLALLGIGSQSIMPLKVAEGNREAIDIADLEKHLKSLNGAPAILISSAGTVNTVDFDDFEAIAVLHKKYNFWWHIDAAFGAFAACSPKYAPILRGWHQADSITVDCHKWLNVPYESAFFLVKNAHRHLQIACFQNSNAPYLGDPLDNFSYLNFLPENSRRLRALPTWFSLMAYGKKGYQDIIENSVAMAQMLGNFIEKTPFFTLLAPVRLNTVCFSFADEAAQNDINLFLQKLNATEKVFMTPTVYQGKKGIRAAFVNWRTQAKDVSMVCDLMLEMNRDF